MPRNGHAIPNESLFIKNLPYEANENHLKDVFSKYGRLKDIYIPVDYYTKEPRGFGYIQFENVKDAESAVNKLQGYKLKGREVEVRFAEGDRKKPGQMVRKEDRHRGRGGSLSPPRRRAPSPRQRRSSPGAPRRPGPRRLHNHAASPPQRRRERSPHPPPPQRYRRHSSPHSHSFMSSPLRQRSPLHPSSHRPANHRTRSPDMRIQMRGSSPRLRRSPPPIRNDLIISRHRTPDHTFRGRASPSPPPPRHRQEPRRARQSPSPGPRNGRRSASPLLSRAHHRRSPSPTQDYPDRRGLLSSAHHEHDLRESRRVRNEADQSLRRRHVSDPQDDVRSKRRNVEKSPVRKRPIRRSPVLQEHRSGLTRSRFSPERHPSSRPEPARQRRALLEKPGSRPRPTARRHRDTEPRRSSHRRNEDPVARSEESRRYRYDNRHHEARRSGAQNAEDDYEFVDEEEYYEEMDEMDDNNDLDITFN